jgi:hypothetical protein
MKIHAHTRARESHPFGFQPKPLLHAVLAAEQDASLGADDPMPWQSAGGVQRPHHLPGGAGKSGHARDLAVGSDPPGRDAPNRGLYGSKHVHAF